MTHAEREAATATALVAAAKAGDQRRRGGGFTLGMRHRGLDA